MSTRSIGDIKSNGQSADEMTNLVPQADVRNAGTASNNNQLNELGQKIFLDRYALKDMRKRTLAVGDMVIVCTDPKTGQREIGTLIAMDETAAGGAGRVTVELKEGSQ